MDRKVNWGILGCAGIAEKAFIPAVLELGRTAPWPRSPRAIRDRARRLGPPVRIRPGPPDLSGARRRPGRRRGLQPPPERPPRRVVHPGHAGRQARPLRKAHGHERLRGPGHDPGGRDARRPAHGRLHVQVPSADRPDASSSSAGSDRRGPLRPLLLHLPLRARRRELPLVPGHGRRGPVRRRLLYDQPRPARLRRRAVRPSTAAARIDPATGVDMTAAALLEFPGGRFAQCDASFESPLPEPAPRRRRAKGRSGSTGPSRPRTSTSRSRSSAAAIRKRSAFRGPTCSRLDGRALRRCRARARPAPLIPPSDALAQHARDRRLLRVHPDRGSSSLSQHHHRVRRPYHEVSEVRPRCLRRRPRPSSPRLLDLQVEARR
ncbi:MAG: hypothetical protein MZV63_65620 [Marinilabiliales bacterium]|nr:hypothetical protein [Marinilabiliales bacterium]